MDALSVSRREFTLSAAAMLGAGLTAVGRQRDSGPSESARSVQRTYHVLGVPLRSGSLYPGNEDDAQAYRDAKLLARLQAAGCNVLDDGNLAIPSYLPHHFIPPIRSWPGPRIVWDIISDRLQPILGQSGHVPLLIGCDCSVVVGTTQALLRTVVPGDIHVIYIDGDFDDAPPEASRSQSAATLAMWLLTHGSPFWSGPALAPSQVTLMGCTVPSRSPEITSRAMLLADIRKKSAVEAARAALAAIPQSAQILLHLDIDVFQKTEMPVAYFPHDEGLTLAEGAQLLSVLAKDRRVRAIEVAEYSTLRDLERHWVSKLIELLAQAL